MPILPALAKLFFPITGYARWLHTRWPAGTVEHLPEVGPDGETALPGVRIVGDLSGIPLLKFSADTGARAVQAMLREPDFKSAGRDDGGTLDLAILGGGVSGISAALEAKKAGLRFQVFEAAEPFTTIANFPKAKPIYTYPTDMTPAGQMQFHADVKEALLDELEGQRKDAGIEITHARADRVESGNGDVMIHFAGDNPPPDACARRVIIAIGRSGDFRRLGVPGEDLDKVANRLHDPADFAGKNVLVVGGGDSALEAATALGGAGAHVTLSYRKKEFNRPKGENVDRLKTLEHASANGGSVAPRARQRGGSHRAGTRHAQGRERRTRGGQRRRVHDDRAGCAARLFPPVRLADPQRMDVVARARLRGLRVVLLRLLPLEGRAPAGIFPSAENHCSKSPGNIRPSR